MDDDGVLRVEVPQGAHDVVDQLVAAGLPGGHRRGGDELVHLRALDELRDQAELADGGVDTRAVEHDDARMPHLAEDPQLVRHGEHVPDAGVGHGEPRQLHGHLGPVQPGSHDHTVAANAQHPLGHQLQVARAEEPALGLPNANDLLQLLLQGGLAVLLRVLELVHLLEDVPRPGGRGDARAVLQRRRALLGCGVVPEVHEVVHLRRRDPGLRLVGGHVLGRLRAPRAAQADPQDPRGLRRGATTFPLPGHPDDLHLHVHGRAVHGDGCCDPLRPMEDARGRQDLRLHALEEGLQPHLLRVAMAEG
mmetsp:Transcript_156568/g.480331  ORF Transcript_156568/g.480331 Transcript_156568/m.480331 type:complete len:306 (-) Transcript_156568:787-1704(-)